jgi:4-oxalocrotonate tautomerase
MPYVNVRLVAGRSPEKKAEMARRIVEAVSEIAAVRPDQVWVVFDDVPKEDWHVGPRLPA